MKEIEDVINKKKSKKEIINTLSMYMDKKKPKKF